MPLSHVMSVEVSVELSTRGQPVASPLVNS